MKQIDCYGNLEGIPVLVSIVLPREINEIIVLITTKFLELTFETFWQIIMENKPFQRG